MRSSAAEALGKIGGKRAVEPLIRALEDRDEDVREKAAEALEKIAKRDKGEILGETLSEEERKNT